MGRSRLVGAPAITSRRAAELLALTTPPAALGRTVKLSIDGADMVLAAIVGAVEDIRTRFGQVRRHEQEPCDVA